MAWATTQRRPIRELLLRHGGILFRGFTRGSVETFRSFIAAVSGEPLPYMEGSSPRHEVADRVYTSTDYPPRHRIPLHNELSYSNTWQLRIFFHCVMPPASGGATPVADCHNVYQRISPALRERLEERDYLYVRHFGPDIGVGWRDAFQTDDRAAVERYCADNDIELTWGAGEELTTRQRRPVSAAHPETGEMTWFNHLTFFNVSPLDPMVAQALLSMGKENLPNNTYYGDGAEIEPAALDELRAAYEAETMVIPWQEGDIMMLDNMLVAHGREAYGPPRQIVVGMAEPWSRFGRSTNQALIDADVGTLLGSRGGAVGPANGERDAMTNHTYRVIEIVGTSPEGIDAAIRNGLSRAAETTRGLDWFEVQSVRGHLENGAVAHFQVTLKVGFRLESA